MNAKRLLALLLSLMLLISLTACGDDADADKGSTTTTTTTAAGDDTQSTDEADGTTDDSTQSTTTAKGDKNTTTAKGDKNTTTAATTTKGGTTTTGSGESTKTVTIKKGSTRLESGLTFNNATLKYPIGLPMTDSMKRLVAQFQLKYKCKIEVSQLGFQTYVQDLAAKNAAGEVYDIIQVEGFRFPSIVITKLVQPIEDLITTADWYNSSKKANGGFDEELTMSFVWNNRLYAAVPYAGPFSPQMYTLFYNKKIFKDNGLDDPRELYEKGKWNWDTFYELGTKLVKNGIWLCDGRVPWKVLGWNGATDIDHSDPEKPKANITSTAHMNAYKYLQKLTFGPNKVVDVDLAGTDETPNLFLQGKTAFWHGFYFDLYENYTLGDGASTSNAFAKKVDNLGMVPPPLGPDNKDGRYVVGSYIYGIGVGVGSKNPKAALAFAKFSATYKSTVKEKYTYSDEDLAIIAKMTAGPKSYSAASYSDASTDVNTLINEMSSKILRGQDYVQVSSAYNARIQNCIDVMISQG